MTQSEGSVWGGSRVGKAPQGFFIGAGENDSKGKLRLGRVLP